MFLRGIALELLLFRPFAVEVTSDRLRSTPGTHFSTIGKKLSNEPWTTQTCKRFVEPAVPRNFGDYDTLPVLRKDFEGVNISLAPEDAYALACQKELNVGLAKSDLVRCEDNSSLKNIIIPCSVITRSKASIPWVFTHLTDHLAEFPILAKFRQAKALGLLVNSQDASEIGVIVDPTLRRFSDESLRKNIQRRLKINALSSSCSRLPETSACVATASRPLVMRMRTGNCDACIDDRVSREPLNITRQAELSTSKECRDCCGSYPGETTLCLTLGPRPHRDPFTVLIPPTSMHYELVVPELPDVHRWRRFLYIIIVGSRAIDKMTPARSIREAVVNAARRFAADLHSKVVVFKRTPQFSPSDAITQYRNAVFCPIPPGDGPYQKRFFDSILCDCIPVVFVFPARLSGKESWWAFGGPAVEDMVPFAGQIDYEKLVVKIPFANVSRFPDYLDSIPETKIRSKRAYIRTVRQNFIYSMNQEPDAFSAIIREVRKATLVGR